MYRGPCVLCYAREATRRGEHVLAQWYLRDRGPGPGPYRWTKNGEPILNREGQPIAPQDRVRIQLPVCKTCNGEMNRRFEQPAKDALRRLFDARGAVVLGADELQALALWFLKTLLLQARPEVIYSAPKVSEAALKWDPSELPSRRFYDWLVTGDAPPSGVSLWLFRAEEGLDDLPPPEFVIPLPTVAADGTVTDFVCFQVTFHGLNITLVVHPGWEIRHPLEESGRALRLWPTPSVMGANVGALPVLPRNIVSWLRCRVHLKPGVLGTAQLPPLRHSTNLMGIQPETWTFAESWGA